jgi:membrane-bound serine protease (ClpP class)
LLAAVAIAVATACSADTPRVVQARLADAIGPASAHFVAKTLAHAVAQDAACYVLELDTPGGLDDSMREIVQRILGADIPVVVYVAPSGARAASAGFFILQAAHVAAMAPGTNTGAAHPVGLGGAKIDSVLAGKIENDAASFVRSLAQRRGRNVDWAESAVRESASLSAPDALERGVIDLVAADLPNLLESIDGKTVETARGLLTLHTRGATVETLLPDWRDRVLSAIANPNIAYILLMLGTLGLAMELWNPGAVFPGVIGAISLLLAFFALQVLPVRQAGLLLLLAGIVMLLLEIKVTSYGALAIGGVAALTFGSIMLFDSPGRLLRVSWLVLVPVVVCTTLCVLFVVGAGVRAQRRRPVTGPEGMIGERGRTEGPVGSDGRVFVHGESWEARADPPVGSGDEIEVLQIEGRRLVVRAVRR